MDILRKELNWIYASQHLEEECLTQECVLKANHIAEVIMSAGDGCSVVTDASCDHCDIYPGYFGVLMGFAEKSHCRIEADSSDEDVIYNRIHPEDIVDKRLLEYEFFKLTDAADPHIRQRFKATCRLRMKDRAGLYRYVENSTRILGLSPKGKIWLILCLYDLSPAQDYSQGISPRIVNTVTGEIKDFLFEARRNRILTEREKEILNLIREGKPSKQVADILGISIHTVNRHRQNIIAKLSVGNIVEAITAATAMKIM